MGSPDFGVLNPINNFQRAHYQLDFVPYPFHGAGWVAGSAVSTKGAVATGGSVGCGSVATVVGAGVSVGT